MQVLVTGASGFLGLAVSRALVESGTRVLGTWRALAPSFRHSALTWIRCDLSRDEDVDGLARMDFDAVFHLAAAIPLGTVTADAAARTNRPVDEAVFRAAAKRAAVVVFASSTSVYGSRRDTKPVREDSRPEPSNAYGQAKLESELSGAEHARTAGARFVALRICAPYGPGQLARTVLQIFIDNALNSRPLAYYGSGTREQAFVFVTDIADAFMQALSADSGCYNIAGSEPVTMKTLAATVAWLAGGPGQLVQPAGRSDPQDGHTARFDIGRAARSLGWRPKVVLREGLARCIAARRTQVQA